MPTAYMDSSAVYCPTCGHVMFGEQHDAGKYKIRCINPACTDHGKQYFAPRLTIELTPVEEA